MKTRSSLKYFVSYCSSKFEYVKWTNPPAPMGPSPASVHVIELCTRIFTVRHFSAIPGTTDASGHWL